MSQLLIKISLFLISWFSVIFFPHKKRMLIKYLPVALFSSLNLMCIIFYFTNHKLWKVKGGRGNVTHTAFLVLFGPYLVMTVWVFYLSKGKFLLYALINIIADIFYAYPLVALLKKFKIYHIKVKSFVFFLVIFAAALLNYSFQIAVEKLYPQTNDPLV